MIAHVSLSSLTICWMPHSVSALTNASATSLKISPPVNLVLGRGPTPLPAPVPVPAVSPARRPGPAAI